jgi:hypothetical protein
LGQASTLSEAPEGSEAVVIPDAEPEPTEVLWDPEPKPDPEAEREAAEAARKRRQEWADELLRKLKERPLASRSDSAEVDHFEELEEVEEELAA